MKEITVADYYRIFKQRKNFQNKSKAHKNGFTRTCDKFVSYFGDRNIASITQDEVEEFLNRREHEVSASAFRLEYAHLHALFRRANDSNYVAVNVVTAIEKPELQRGEPQCLTIKQCKLLLKYAQVCDDATAKWRAKNKRSKEDCSIVGYYALALFAALRPYEVRRAEWADIDWDEGVIRARQTQR